MHRAVSGRIFCKCMHGGTTLREEGGSGFLRCRPIESVVQSRRAILRPDGSHSRLCDRIFDSYK